MPIAIDLLKSPCVKDIPLELNENISLYSAQKAAKEIFKNYSFPKCVELKQDYLLNKICNVIKFFNSVIYKTYMLFYTVIGGGINSSLFIGDCLFGWLLRPIIDYMFPINPINGKRGYYLLPKIVEKWLGDIMYKLLSCEETNEFLAGTSIPMSEKIRQVFNRMVDVNKRLLNPANEHVKFDYRIQTISSKSLNAYAMPAGGVTIYSKLAKEINDAVRNKTIRFTDIKFPNGGKIRVDLSKVRTDDVLAAVLGHEMTHIACRHSSIRLAFMFINKIIMGIFHVIFIKSLKEKNPVLEEKLRFLEEKISHIIELFKSRDQEYEADVTGIYLARQAQYNPLGILFLEEILKQDRDEFDKFMHRNFEFLYTHPYEENRKLAAFAAINEIDPENLQKHIL